MVYLSQNVGEVDWVRIDSGGGPEPAQVYRFESRVDRREVRRGYRDQATLIQLPLFKIDKEERTIAHDGARVDGSLLLESGLAALSR